MLRNTTPAQLLARIDHPEWNTANGRILDEARTTFMAFAEGKTPQTVLGGLMLNARFDVPSTERGRSIGQIVAKVHMEPTRINHRGDMIQDVLDDLIETGWVEPEEPLPGTVEAALLTDPGEGYNPLIHYKLVTTTIEHATN